MPLCTCSCPASALNSSIRAFTSCRVTASRGGDRLEVDRRRRPSRSRRSRRRGRRRRGRAGREHGEPQPALQHDLVLRRPELGQLRAGVAGGEHVGDLRHPQPSVAASPKPSRVRPRGRSTSRVPRRPRRHAAMSLRWWPAGQVDPARPRRTPRPGLRQVGPGRRHRQHPPAAADDHGRGVAAGAGVQTRRAGHAARRARPRSRRRLAAARGSRARPRRP